MEGLQWLCEGPLSFAACIIHLSLSLEEREFQHGRLVVMSILLRSGGASSELGVSAFEGVLVCVEPSTACTNVGWLAICIGKTGVG